MAYENVFCVTHKADMDGIASAALAMRRFGMPGKNIILNSYDDNSFFGAMLEIEQHNPRRSLIIFTDFAINIDKAEKMRRLFLGLKKKGNSIIYIDHHNWAESAIKDVASLCDYAVVGENKDFCAAELTEKLLFGGNDRIASHIAAVAHVTDFHLPTKNATIKKIVLAIEYFNITDAENLKKLAKFFSVGVFSNSFIDHAYEAYKKAEKKQIAMLDKSITHVDSVYRIGFGFGKRIQTNVACDRIMRRTGAQIAVYVNLRNGTAHLRSAKGVDCSRLAEHFHGGGHPHAAGFQPSISKFMNFNAEGRKRFIVSTVKGVSTCFTLQNPQAATGSQTATRLKA